MTINQLADVNGCGRDAIRSAVRELEELGYLTRSQNRTNNGTFSEALWETTEPMTESPMTENPSTVNPSLKNTNPKNTNLKKLYALSNEDFDAFWETYPRKVGKKATRSALERAVREIPYAEIMEGVRRLASDPNLPPKEYIPYPATWLNREGWSDEPYPVRGGSEKTKPKAEVPERGAWKRRYHDDGDHTFCERGDFDH